MKTNSGILSVVGGTPLIRLERMFVGAQFSVFAKLEAFNPAGSIKDRPALNILRQALAGGDIDSQSVIIESSSGNMGIGLAQACACFGLRFICVVDKNATSQNIRILKAYGAEVDLVERPDPETGEFLPQRIKRVKSLLDTTPNSFWPNQYASLHNSSAHRQTMHEIVEACEGGKVDYLFCAVSTCGTLRGCAEYVRDKGMDTAIVAVDAIGSVLFGGTKAKRLIPGHGASIVPTLFRSGLASEHIQVSDLDCIVGCRRLVKREGILAGGSSGAVITACEHFRSQIPPGRNCVLILSDRGERYLDTIYSDEWVSRHFGDVSYLWQAEQGEHELCKGIA